MVLATKCRNNLSNGTCRSLTDGHGPPIFVGTVYNKHEEDGYQGGLEEWKIGKSFRRDGIGGCEKWRETSQYTQRTIKEEGTFFQCPDNGTIVRFGGNFCHVNPHRQVSNGRKKELSR